MAGLALVAAIALWFFALRRARDWVDAMADELTQVAEESLRASPAVRQHLVRLTARALLEEQGRSVPPEVLEHALTRAQRRWRVNALVRLRRRWRRLRRR